METDRNVLGQTIKLSEHVEDLKLPNDLDCLIYSPEIFATIDKLSKLLEKLKNNLNDAKSSIQTIKEVCELNLKNYVGIEDIPDIPIENMALVIDSSLNNKEALNTHIALREFIETAELQPYSELLKTSS